jgi:hypothetical protein
MKKAFLLFIFLIIFSCKDTKKNEVSFYFWRTKFALSTQEEKTLINNKVTKLYVRYFDVALQNNIPFPIKPIQFEKKAVKQKIIPTIFIKNEVFLSEKTNIEKLSSNILKLINQINTAHKIPNSEIQIDCDWSLESRDNYMRFLKLLKVKYGKTLSATIRLHQVKYFEKTKVPPVDYGVLMLYNIGTVNAKGEKAIYDKKIALQYLPYLEKYPLKIKTALPIFSWLVHTRKGQVVQIISKKNINDYQNKINFDVDYPKHVVTKSGIAFGDFYKKDDILFEETISPDDIEEMKTLIHKYSKHTQTEFIYYDLDQKNLNKNRNEYTF